MQASLQFYSEYSCTLSRTEDASFVNLAQEATHDSFTLMSTSCPPGYVLSAAPLHNMYNTCECDSQNSDIMDCNQHRIILRVSFVLLQIKCFYYYLCINIFAAT